jgi:hypothetical protein
MMRVLIRLILVSAVLGLALPAWAGDGSSSSPLSSIAPAARHAKLGIRAYGLFDFTALTAKQSYSAVLGSSHVTAFGGGADVLDVWKHVFVRVAVSHAAEKGSRVFVDNGQVFSLHIPITISWTPVEVGGGWRFRPGYSATSSITPYVGGAFVALDYKEASQFAQPGDNVSTYLTGVEGFGGVEFGLLKWLSVAGEAQYRTIPNALGSAGVTKDFNEKDAGGFTARVLVAFRR